MSEPVQVSERCECPSDFAWLWEDSDSNGAGQQDELAFVILVTLGIA